MLKMGLSHHYKKLFADLNGVQDHHKIYCAIFNISLKFYQNLSIMQDDIRVASGSFWRPFLFGFSVVISFAYPIAIGQD